MSISPLLPIVITFAIALFIVGLPSVVLGKIQSKVLFKITTKCAFIAVSSASIYAYFSNYSLLDILLFQKDLAYPFGQLILLFLGKILYISTIVGLTSFALLVCSLVRVLWVKITLTHHSSGTG
jgi:hypothetical protein